MTDHDVEDALDEIKQQDRTTAEPTTPDTSREPDLDAAAAEAFAAIDRGDLAINVTVRDENLAALFEALDETDRLASIEAEANEAIGRDVNADGTKASLARALLRVGFEEVAPDAIEDAATGYGIHLEKQKSEQTSNF